VKKFACRICPTGAHYLEAGQGDVPKLRDEPLDAWWRRVHGFLWHEGISSERLAVLMRITPTREEGDALVFAGAKPDDVDWLSHLVPIVMGREFRSEP
jgi:hypothetical protein